jgi:adenine-specific DNA-methyltransferase
MDRRPAVVGVPTQVLEVVSPGLASREAGRQVSAAALSGKVARSTPQPPTNRLIWTNDNLVALQTLLDERDPSGAPRYRGKVDLVYIDPPFMVNSNFVADNAITVDVDEGEGVSATKEPSLVELLAYKDTWREGLDSFLSMMRARLVLLKDLLAPTGSIYVHLDWHAAHYVKVLMDEIFGYDRFRNEIVWYYYNKYQGNINRFPSNHDTILCYGGEGTVFFQPQKEARDAPVRQLVREWDPDKKALVNAKGPDGKVMYQTTAEKGVDDVWRIPMLQPADMSENLGYPTQKRMSVVERIISASCPPGGLVLDAFGGSGTTAEAAERLGRRWISIDISKYAVHLSRKRLIGLHGSPRPAPVTPDYVDCASCKAVSRKDRKGRSPGPFSVAPFSVENMGVYQRAEAWLTQLGAPGAWRAELVRVYGGEPMADDPLLHGRKGDELIHLGPLDAPVPAAQIWPVARAAAAFGAARLTVLSADLDLLDGPSRDSLERLTGVKVTLRVIPQAALEAVAARLSRGARADGARESMAIPAFYSPLSVSARASVNGRSVRLSLDRCEVDTDAFLASQAPALPDPEAAGTPKAKQRAHEAAQKWAARRSTLLDWLKDARSWQHFVDFWAVDWDYGDHQGPDGRPIFDTEWQSTRVREGKSLRPVLTEAEGAYAAPGRYQIGVKVTDVFGNDGLAVVDVEVR